MKKSLAWFSPLPPQKNDIAEYTELLRPSLDALFEVSYFADTPTGFTCATTGKRYHCGLGAIPFPLIRELNSVSTPLYHFGNHGEDHRNTWFLCRAKPGIVVLHDGSLVQVIDGIYNQRLGDRGRFLHLMHDCYGEPGLEAAAAVWEGTISTEAMGDRFPLVKPAVENALAVIVHTRQLFDTVRALTSTPAFYLAPPHSPRQESGVAGDTPERYVQALYEIASQTEVLRRRHAAFHVATNVGHNVASLAPAASQLQLAPRYAEAIAELLGPTV